MEVRTLWQVIIKGLGVWFTAQALFYSVPQFFMLFYTLGEDYTYVNNDGFSVEFGAIVIVLLTYLFLFWLLVFKTDWIISKLKLAESSEARIELDMKSSTILSVAVIIIGGFVFFEGLVVLVRQATDFFAHKINFKDYGQMPMLVFDVVRIVIGYLLITKSKVVVTFIESESGKS